MKRRAWFAPDLVLASVAVLVVTAWPSAPRSASEGSPAHIWPVDAAATSAPSVLPVRSGAPIGHDAPPPPSSPSTSGTGAAASMPATRKAARPRSSPAPTKRLRVITGSIGHVQLGGVAGAATWYCKPGRSACTKGYPPDQCRVPWWRCYAAAGPLLRDVLGPGWMGRRVRVSAGGSSVVVTLIDWCACPGGRAIDLYSQAFEQLADLAKGQITVALDVL